MPATAEIEVPPVTTEDFGDIEDEAIELKLGGRLLSVLPTNPPELADEWLVPGYFQKEYTFEIAVLGADKLAVRGPRIWLAESGSWGDVPNRLMVHELSFAAGAAGIEIGFVLLDVDRNVVRIAIPTGYATLFHKAAIDFTQQVITLDDVITVPLLACAMYGVYGIVPVPLQWPTSSDDIDYRLVYDRRRVSGPALHLAP